MDKDANSSISPSFPHSRTPIKPKIPVNFCKHGFNNLAKYQKSFERTVPSYTSTQTGRWTFVYEEERKKKDVHIYLSFTTVLLHYLHNFYRMIQMFREVFKSVMVWEQVYRIFSKTPIIKKDISSIVELALSVLIIQ